MKQLQVIVVAVCVWCGAAQAPSAHHAFRPDFP